MSYDIVIFGASILDGTGADAFTADIAIEGGRIAAIGSVSGGGKTEIRADGPTASPGFIDVHTHDDRLLLSDPAVSPKVSQGVTTVVTGNCGISLAPLLREGPPPAPLTLLGGRSDLFFKTFKDYVAALKSHPTAVNAVPFVGHSSLRVCAMDELDRPASDSELAAMKALLEEAMAAGAFGLTTGLYYPGSRMTAPWRSMKPPRASPVKANCRRMPPCRSTIRLLVAPASHWRSWSNIRSYCSICRRRRFTY